MSLKKKFLKTKPICKVTFTLPQEAANDSKEVILVGDFNDWDQEQGIPMKLKNGEFTVTVDLPVEQEYQFRYLIDNEVWENDWEADNYVTGPYGNDNSVVSLLASDKELEDIFFN